MREEAKDGLEDISDDDEDDDENDQEDDESDPGDMADDSNEDDDDSLGKLEDGDPTSDSSTNGQTQGTTSEQNEPGGESKEDAKDDSDDAHDTADADDKDQEKIAPGDQSLTSSNETTSASSNETSSEPSLTSGAIAFVQFELLQMQQSTSEDDSGFKLVSIFSNSSFTGPFAGSPITSVISDLETADNTSWYEDSAVEDRIAFQIRCGTLDAESYAISVPTVTVSSNAGIEPKIEFQFDKDMGVGTFTIVYNCVMGKPGSFLISFSMSVTKDERLDTGWLKTCGQGRFENMRFGFLDHNSEMISFNSDGTHGTEEHKKLEVGPMESSTDLKVILTSPAANLNFLTPYVMSDSADVTVKLRSTIAAGIFEDDQETTFTVLYDCEAKSTGNVKFTVGIPPWDNITTTWRKDCGGSMSQALLIGTGGSESFDVMQEGQLKPEFTVSEMDSVETVDTRVEVFPADVHSKKFFLTNSDDTSDIHFQKVSITLSNPSVMKVVVGANGRSGLASVGGVLQRGDVTALNLFFMCNEVGKTVALVTLPTVRYQNVEFGFVKECDGAPKSYHHVGFLQTASSLLDVLLVLGIGCGVALVVYTLRNRASGTKYSAVSTSAT